MKIFRDPIHNVIDLDTGDKQINDLILKLIDSKDFQRLRFIKQLGLANYAYPSANHARFEHSLGVAYLAKRFIDKLLAKETVILHQIKDGKTYDQFAIFFSRLRKDRIVTILAALLHDIGHGPLSHVSEPITGVRHEYWVREILLGNTEINRILTKYDADYPKNIWDILSNSCENPMPTAKLISGQLDIDKIDYLLRDAHMTGSEYGKFDIEWLINVINVGIVNGHVEIGLDLERGLSVAEGFVIARINMFKNVYLHKISSVAQNMLMIIFERIRDTRELVDIHPIQKIFIDNIDPTTIKSHLEDYLDMTDIEMNYFLKSLKESKDAVLKKLSQDLMYRNFFKEVSKNEYDTAVAHINTTKGEHMSKYYTTVVDVVDRKGGLRYRPDKDQIFVFDKKGIGYDLAEKSAMINTSKKENDYELQYFIDRDIYLELYRR